MKAESKKKKKRKEKRNVIVKKTINEGFEGKEETLFGKHLFCLISHSFSRGKVFLLLGILVPLDFEEFSTSLIQPQ